jgi:hypothetical protein
VGAKGSFPGGYGNRGVTLTNHPYLVLMLKMSGGVMSTSPHACMAGTGSFNLYLVLSSEITKRQQKMLVLPMKK